MSWSDEEEIANGSFWYDSPPPVVALAQSAGANDGRAAVAAEVVSGSQSAPPHPSPEFEELPQFPPRLRPSALQSGGTDGTTGSRVRWTAKAFFLTYSQSHLPREAVTYFFSRQGRLKRMIVGMEHHQDGNWHWHVLVEYDVTKDIRNARHFDIQGEHPNVVWYSRSAPQTYEQWFLNHWEYCKKEDPTPFVVGTPPTVDENRKRKRDETFSESMEICQVEGVQSAMDFLRRVAPYELVTKYDQIYRTMVAIRNQSTNTQAPARSVEEYRAAPLLPDDWHCLYINGGTGLGKTAWARALLPEATVVRHSDQLRTVDFSKGVIFDDFDIGHWPPTAAIHLLDWDEPSGINVKHAHVVIPAHTRKIFTHNGSFERWVSKDATDEQIEAMRRRISVVNIYVRLY